MSHADDGTLHAYLDGELSPVERERLDRHLADCAACRARLDEERALIERADALLALAAPPERAAPPLSELRKPRPMWVVRYPLAWAATIVLAFGVGWYLHGLPSPEAEPAVALVPRAPAITAGRADVERRDEAASPPAAAAKPADHADALASLAAPRDSLPGVGVEAPAPRVLAPQNQAALRGEGPAPVPPTRVVLRAADRPPLFDARQAPTSTTWPIIAPGPARDVLGGAPAQIPGLRVLGIRRNPADPAEIVVEQGLDSGTVVEIYQRRLAPEALDNTQAMRAQAAAIPRASRADTLARSASAARPARIIGALHVEIAGPLSVDSLLRLLQLVR